MKIKQFFKKAAATVMAAVTVLSLLPTTAFAATGDVGTISFTRTYDSAGNAMYYNSSAVINGYTGQFPPLIRKTTMKLDSPSARSTEIGGMHDESGM